LVRILTIAFVFLFSNSWGQINENIQSWTNQASYGSYTQNIAAGTVSMTQCIIQNAASSVATGCSIGRVQMNSSSGIIELPSLASVGICEFHIVAGGTGRSVKLQYNNAGTWTDLTTFTGIGTTCGTYTFNVNSCVATTLRLSSPSAAIYVHDIIVPLNTSCGSCTVPATPPVPTTASNPACSTATLSVGSSTVSGVTWYWQTSAGGTSTTQPTSSNYTTASTATVFVRAQDNTGLCWSAASSSLAVTVNTPPTITLSPVSKTVCEGSGTTFTASASGSSPTYQWYENTGSGYSPLSNAGIYTGTGTKTLTLSSSTISMNTYSYLCVASVSGCSSASTTPVVLTVATIPAAPPTPSIITSCNPAIISETVVGTPPAGVTWYWASNATAPVTFTSAVNDYSATSSGTVYIRAKNDLAACWNTTATTNSVVVSVINPPSITTQPSSSVVCQGNSASVKVTMSASSSTLLTYQWQENTGSGFTNISNGSPYTIGVGTYTSTLGIDGTKPVGTYTYQCIISNSCGTVTTSIVTVSVNVTPANDLCTNASTVVIDGGLVIGNLNCASPTAGLSYNPSKNDVWYVFTPTCTATHTVTMTFTTSGADYDVDIFNTASCPSSGSATFTSHGTTTVETISQTFSSGVTYYIRVLDYNTSGGTFSISVASSCGPPRTVTFDSNGGSGTMSNQTSGSATNLTSNAFTNSGCFFVAWNTAADGSGTTYANGAVYSFTADITLYAQWNCSGGSSFSCSGAVGNGKVQGCGDTSPCDLSTIGTYLDGVSCGTTLNTSCTGACDVEAPYSKQISVPAGCTATVIAEMKVRPGGCSNSGMDSGDLLAITNSGGTVISQTGTLSNGGTVTGSSINKNSGTGNADGWVQMVITGGVVTVSGSGQRGDEIVTYTVNFEGACGAGCNTILPITLLDFYGVQKNNKNELVWKVAEEENIKRYVIEKSSDGVNFEHMIGVYPTPGNYDKTYRTEDLNPYDGITYYRLATMENDYSVQYYKIISMTDSNKKNWGYYYYQSDNSLNVEFKNALPEGALMSLYDMSGQTIVEEIITNTETKISTNNLSSGVYFVRIATPYKIENFKVVITK